MGIPNSAVRCITNTSRKFVSHEHRKCFLPVLFQVRYPNDEEHTLADITEAMDQSDDKVDFGITPTVSSVW